ncbi:hypothetical protein KAM448_45010 [Aeromonas caviae]|uniref:Uncharacterized protein n=1 Tax=Aeromonas caviae TaxID=648 RepID=A0ABD0BGX5_AERCA|nr:hypothetical protein KAM365_44860 [Aeromonas caviae]GJB43826.1 hypothetical protein KAM369_43010 [Aeromonas caviae]GJB61909.1 hypothetical protein KAM374_44450 [Aeromonas caviae]GJB66269.1 hypothetical protein KAM375_43230 [Aeromonas caviae]GJB94394.1 hypothetical protein KAM382_44550 [Aeromonas caviae]
MEVLYIKELFKRINWECKSKYFCRENLFDWLRGHSLVWGRRQPVAWLRGPVIEGVSSLQCCNSSGATPTGDGTDPAGPAGRCGS